MPRWSSTKSRVLISADLLFFEVDAGDCEATGRILSEFRGKVSIPASIRKPQEYYRNNTWASLQLIEQAMRSGVEAFIFSSTAAVYGHSSTEAFRENAATEQAHPYGHS